VSVRTQLLPDPVAEQVKSPGPLHPAGKVVFDSASPCTGNPSAEVKATVIVWLAPGITDTVPATDAVAVTG
jgi:hypothetical protein